MKWLPSNSHSAYAIYNAAVVVFVQSVHLHYCVISCELFVSFLGFFSAWA